jgi:ABC-2 type transport system permease protein
MAAARPPSLWRICRLEARLLVRRGVLVTTILAFALCAAAGLISGRRIDDSRSRALDGLAAEATARRGEQRTQIAAYRDNAASAPLPSYAIDEPALLPSRPLGFLSMGAGDSLPAAARITLYADPLALFDEPAGTENPEVLALGRFDLAFVFVWLLPLAVLAVSHDVVSADRDSGIWSMLASQPLPVGLLLVVRLTLVGLSVLAVAMAVVVVGILVDRRSPAPVDLALLALHLAGYIAFWLALAAVVATRRWSSSANALTLVVLWLVLVPVAPEVLRASLALGGRTPDRPAMVAEAQRVYAKAVAAAEDLMDEYYRAHPEYDRTVAPGIDRPMRDYWIALDAAGRAAAPALTTFETARDAYDRRLTAAQWVLPSLALQRGLERLAGNDDARHWRFEAQARAYYQTMQAVVIPRLFESRPWDLPAYEALPLFSFEEAPPEAHRAALVGSALALLAAALVVGTAAWRLSSYTIA